MSNPEDLERGLLAAQTKIADLEKQNFSILEEALADIQKLEEKIKSQKEEIERQRLQNQRAATKQNDIIIDLKQIVEQKNAEIDQLGLQNSRLVDELDKLKKSSEVLSDPQVELKDIITQQQLQVQALTKALKLKDTLLAQVSAQSEEDSRQYQKNLADREGDHQAQNAELSRKIADLMEELSQKNTLQSAVNTGEERATSSLFDELASSNSTNSLTPTSSSPPQVNATVDQHPMKTAATNISNSLVLGSFNQYLADFKNRFKKTNSTGIKKMIKEMEKIRLENKSDDNKFILLAMAMSHIANERKDSRWSHSHLIFKGRDDKVDKFYKEIASNSSVENLQSCSSKFLDITIMAEETPADTIQMDTLKAPRAVRSN